MSTMRRAAAGALAFLIGTRGAAQAPPTLARYQTSNDTLRYEIMSPFSIYWVRGAESLAGPSAPGWQFESHVWRGTASRPEVITRTEALDMARAATIDTFAVSQDGRIVLKNGAPPAADAWIDVFPRLPKIAVRPGLTWSDTLVSLDTTAGRLFRTTRVSVIARIVDTLGIRRLEIATQGRARIKLTFDSTSWIDVSGPTTEQVIFDLTRGRLIRRTSSMLLSGVGVAPASLDTLPALFQTSTAMELTDPARAQVLTERARRIRPPN